MGNNSSNNKRQQSINTTNSNPNNINITPTTPMTKPQSVNLINTSVENVKTVRFSSQLNQNNKESPNHSKSATMNSSNSTTLSDWSVIDNEMTEEQVFESFVKPFLDSEDGDEIREAVRNLRNWFEKDNRYDGQI